MFISEPTLKCELLLSRDCIQSSFMFCSPAVSLAPSLATDMYDFNFSLIFFVLTFLFLLFLRL